MRALGVRGRVEQMFPHHLPARSIEADVLIVALRAQAALSSPYLMLMVLSVLLGLKTAFVGWPCLLLLPMIWLAWRYPLDRRAHGILAKRLAARAAAE